MLVRNKNVGLSIAMLLFVLLLPRADIADENKQLESKLISALSDFAKANALSDEQLRRLLGESLLNAPYFSKGGLGLIDSKETYIVLDDVQNKILLNHQEWQGLDSSKTEIVLVDDRRVLGSVGGVDLSNLKIVVFSPKEVHFVNMSNYAGGRFPRYLPSKSSQ